ncbi:MAG: hypothetical protein F6K18_17960 [Okeania sp. SIO2C2]|uniref:hypothetical protein n=1 Tax=Okeania sp. SIO2C2 TaxID=2607787 RepID=UPI0013B9D456|nr:hypothetical protein [Okeania sp. SIO2C2]NEP88564.1 hypothetical protein [Okeania sp. SIO2C2]
MLSFNSDKILSEDVNISQTDRYNISSNLTLSEKVMKMEQRLEKEFEDYFDREIQKFQKLAMTWLKNC